MSPKPDFNPHADTGKAKNFKTTMLALARYMKPYYIHISVVMIFAVGSTIFSIIGPKMLGKVTTKLYEGLIAWYAQTGLLTDFKYISNMIIGLIILYIVSGLFSYIQSYVMSGVTMKVTYKFRKDISEKMHRLPLNYYDTRTHGEILSRITNDIDTLSQTLNQSITQIITSVTMLIGVFVMMCSISFLMAFVALLVVPLSMALMMAVIKRSQQYFKGQQIGLGKINGHVEEMYGGHNIVQAFNREEDSVRQFGEINDELYNSAWKSQFMSGMMMPIMTFVSNLGYVIICILGGNLAVHNVVSVGDIQAFIQYMRSFTMPITQIANISNTLQSTAAAAERVFEFLSEEEESPETDTIPAPNPVYGNVEFKNVYFGYTPDKIIIHNFSVSVKSGQKIAIVGPTGAGKSTVIKALMRFYELSSGQILIDGADTAKMKRSDVRAMFGMVLQDTWLYHASILDNIRYGNFDKTREEVIKAAKAAHCDEFIRALPNGYDTEMNEDADNISQGQKQLLTIARVILADPKILILDEATSSVDTRTEKQIQKAMDALTEGRTSFVIAHRLSTIRDADVILVLKDGDIMEQGSHDELLKKNGFYADLYNSQFSEGEE